MMLEIEILDSKVDSMQALNDFRGDPPAIVVSKLSKEVACLQIDLEEEKAKNSALEHEVNRLKDEILVIKSCLKGSANTANNADLNSSRLVRVNGENTLPKGLSHKTVLEYQNNNRIMKGLTTANDSIIIVNDDKYKNRVAGQEGDQYSTKQYNSNAELNTPTPISVKVRLDKQVHEYRN